MQMLARACKSLMQLSATGPVATPRLTFGQINAHNRAPFVPIPASAIKEILAKIHRFFGPRRTHRQRAQAKLKNADAPDPAPLKPNPKSEYRNQKRSLRSGILVSDFFLNRGWHTGRTSISHGRFT